MKIIGEYSFIINFTNMFINTTTTINYKNMITDRGLEHFAKKILETEKGTFKHIIFGTSTEENKPNYEIKDFKNPYIVETDSYTDGNKIILVQSNIEGQNIDGTTEIGTTIELEDTGEEILVSRNKHSPINIPVTSTMTMNYTFTLQGE